VLIDQLPVRRSGRISGPWAVQRARGARRRAPVLFLALGAACAVLTGCGSGPNQAGAAVIVGSSSVSLTDVQARVDDVLRRSDVMSQLTGQGNTPGDIARFVATREVQHLLLTQSAQRDGIRIDDQQVDAELAKPETTQMLDGDLVFDPGAAREAVRDQLIAEALTTKYLDRLAVTVDVTTATSRPDALNKARLLAAGPVQASAVLAADGPNAQKNLQLRAALVPQSAALFLFGTPAGQVVATQTSASPDVWTVVRVTRRSIDAPPIGDPNATSVAQLGDQTMDQIGRRLTQPLAEELGVRVNPRYGTWDPLFLSVLPPGQEPSVVLPAVLS
jgi:hypothetical protein